MKVIVLILAYAYVVSAFYVDEPAWKPGKRCNSIFDDSCINSGLVGASGDHEWLSNSGPGKKRTLFDDNNANGGLPGASSDHGWLNGNLTPGKRNLQYAGIQAVNEEASKELSDLLYKLNILKGSNIDGEFIKNNEQGKKRTLFDDSNANGGVPGARGDHGWLIGDLNPGKRNLEYTGREGPNL